MMPISFWKPHSHEEIMRNIFVCSYLPPRSSSFFYIRPLSSRKLIHYFLGTSSKKALKVCTSPFNPLFGTPTINFLGKKQDRRRTNLMTLMRLFRKIVICFKEGFYELRTIIETFETPESILNNTFFFQTANWFRE